VKSGYTFLYVPSLPDSQGDFQAYSINGNPTTPGSTGEVYYYTDASYVIRFNNAHTATSTDMALSK
jgi:hypothetical protein